MSLLLPNHATLYAALLARDASYDGRAFVGVYTSGEFCRLTCTTRKPDPESCQFFETVSECLNAGLRPCKRCYPLSGAALESAPERRWTESDVALMGFDPATVRRSFKRHYGVTFLELARLRRLQSGFINIRSDTSNASQPAAEFDNPEDFRNGFAQLLGIAPDALRSNARLQADWIKTPIGDMIAVSDRTHLFLLEFADRKALGSELAVLFKDAKGDIGIGQLPPVVQVRRELTAYFAGTNATFSVPLATGGTAFSQSVWRALRQIPAGDTRTYSALAADIGHPSAVRAVARANGANRLAIIVPCHRILGVDGSLTGYGGGLWRKDRLISLERTYQRIT
jgi:AraC family transcriptional regulator of adaptative response/methylated-DNA-[protein]-cysteine methyltransferase